jgi:hypothetical protein
MHTPNAPELDKNIQFLLVTKIRQAANVYRAAPAGSSAEALLTYVAALENLAEYVADKWRGESTVPDIAAARQRFPVKHPPVKPSGAGRVLQFVAATAAGPTPFNAA